MPKSSGWVSSWRISSGWLLDTAVCHPDDISYHHMSSGWLSPNRYLIRMSYDNVIMSSGWHRLPFVSHPDEIVNFDFPHHAVALQRFRIFPCLSASSFNIGSSRRIGSSGEALEVNRLTAVIEMADILKKKFSNAFIWAKLYHNPIAPYPQWWTFYRRHFQIHFIQWQFSKFWFPSQRASNVESVLYHDVIISLTMVYQLIPADYTRWRRRPLCDNAVPTFRYQSTDAPRPVWYSTLSIYRCQFSSKNPRKTSYSSSVRVRYWVSFVSSSLTECRCYAVCNFVSWRTVIYQTACIPDTLGMK